MNPAHFTELNDLVSQVKEELPIEGGVGQIENSMDKEPPVATPSLAEYAGPGIEPIPCIIIDPEFASLMPEHSSEELSQLEENLQAARECRDALVVWKRHNILLDGHGRFGLCQKLGLPFTTHAIELPDREAAWHWVVNNQLGRRNLTP